MRQSYFGSTASAAIAQAKLDAGDDVVLVELRAELNGAGFTAIIETGFLNLDRSILTNRTDLVANGIVQGILCFVNNENVEPTPLPTFAP